MRTSIVLGKTGGALQPLKRLAKTGLGGPQGPGNQYFSWIHEHDFVSVIDFMIKNNRLHGVYNLAVPVPVTNTHFMEALRNTLRMPVGLPLPTWLLKLGAILINTEAELILKSRKVISKRLIEAGYSFQYNSIEKALQDLLSQ